MSIEYEAEREIDLARWRDAIVAWWWLPVAGLVLGALVGALFSVSAGSTYRATTLLSLGQPFAPGGGPVNGLITNPRTVGEIIRSESAIEQAAARSGMSPGQLRGHISTTAILPLSARANAQPILTVEVTGSNPTRVERSANALADVVIQSISGDYVQQKFKAVNAQLKSINAQIGSVNTRIGALTRALNGADKSGLNQTDQLVLVNLLDNAEARLGGLIAAQSAGQQQLALARNIESPRIVQPAASVKTTARSRRTSIVVGALIGLLLGAAAAIVVDGRVTARR